MLGDFFSWLEGLSGHTWFLAIIFLIAFADSVIPIVPSETMVIIGGVSAGLGQLNVVLVILVAMIGAFLGDNMAYQIGRSAGPFLRRFLFRGAKGEKRLSWAEQQLKSRGRASTAGQQAAGIKFAQPRQFGAVIEQPGVEEIR